MYDELAANFHSIVENWDFYVEWQAGIIGPLVERECGAAPQRLLDCACGIGSQALGLAKRGHQVTASDIGSGAVYRARREAQTRGLAVEFQVAGMRDLGPVGSGFDAVVCLDNSLPHLDSDEDLLRAGRAISAKLRPGGLLLASIRDYDRLIAERPAMQAPRFFNDGGRRRIVHQVWDWLDDRRYRFHIYITRETEAGWECRHYTSVYRGVLREELSAILRAAGFDEVRWLAPEESGYFQPVVLARKTSST